MKCNHCNKEISDEKIAKYLAAKGGSKSKRVITLQQQERMQAGRRAKGIISDDPK